MAWSKINYTKILVMLTCICWSSSLAPPGLVVVGSTLRAPRYRRIASERLVFTGISFRKCRYLFRKKCLTIWIVSCATASRRCSDPVVVYWLVGVENRRDPLSSIDIYVLNFDWIMFNAIGLHECDVVVVDREGEKWPARQGKDTEPVTLAFFNVDHGKWN